LPCQLYCSPNRPAVNGKGRTCRTRSTSARIASGFLLDVVDTENMAVILTTRGSLRSPGHVRETSRHFQDTCVRTDIDRPTSGMGTALPFASGNSVAELLALLNADQNPPRAGGLGSGAWSVLRGRSFGSGIWLPLPLVRAAESVDTDAKALPTGGPRALSGGTLIATVGTTSGPAATAAAAAALAHKKSSASGSPHDRQNTSDGNRIVSCSVGQSYRTSALVLLVARLRRSSAKTKENAQILSLIC